MKDSIYFRQANLVLDVLPIIDKDQRFALKGGTAINFFIRSLPRLSVDIDLTYLPIEDRDTTLKNIDDALGKLSEQVQARFPDVVFSAKRLKENNRRYGLIIGRGLVQIKIEPNLVFRGSVFPVTKRNLVQRAQDMFEKSVKVQCLSLADVYGSKICATLDRQHPRDLFDVKLLFENEGITEEIRQAFIIYLISHNRPMIELLNPNEVDIDKTFKIEFSGMTLDRVSLEELKSVRRRLISVIRELLSEAERRFLLSVKYGRPEWDLFPVKDIERLPAIQWKLRNIGKMTQQKHKTAFKRLKEFLEL